MKVYILAHVDWEEWEILGVYASRQAAEDARVALPRSVRDTGIRGNGWVAEIGDRIIEWFDTEAAAREYLRTHPNEGFEIEEHDVIGTEPRE